MAAGEIELNEDFFNRRGIGSSKSSAQSQPLRRRRCEETPRQAMPIENRPSPGARRIARRITCNGSRWPFWRRSSRMDAMLRGDRGSLLKVALERVGDELGSFIFSGSRVFGHRRHHHPDRYPAPGRGRDFLARALQPD